MVHERLAFMQRAMDGADRAAWMNGGCDRRMRRALTRRLHGPGKYRAAAGTA
jgi:hypothetical protein